METMNQQNQAPLLCPECSKRNDVQDKIAHLLNEVLARMKDQDAEVKATVPELLKLLQLNRDYQEDRGKEIKVTWITTKKQ
jgi:hypothetical protein